MSLMKRSPKLLALSTRTTAFASIVWGSQETSPKYWRRINGIRAGGFSMMRTLETSETILS
jgi:hypothetical protein